MVGKQPYPASKSLSFQNWYSMKSKGEWMDEEMDEAEQTGKSTKWASRKEMFLLGHFSWSGLIFTRFPSLSGNICWASSLSAGCIVWHWYLQGKNTHTQVCGYTTPCGRQTECTFIPVTSHGSSTAPVLWAGTASARRGSEPNLEPLVLESMVWVVLTIPVAHSLASASFYPLSDYSWSAQLNSHSWNYPGRPCLYLWNNTSTGFSFCSACMQAPKGILCTVMLCLFIFPLYLQPIPLFSCFPRMNSIGKSILHIDFVPLLPLNFLFGYPSTMTLFMQFCHMLYAAYCLVYPV